MRRLALLGLLAVALAPTAARAQPRVMTAFGIRYVPEVVEIEEGDRLTFVNADPLSLNDGHNVTEMRAEGLPARFVSDTVLIGFATEVRGVEDLPPADYEFYCTLHPPMRGLLRVSEGY